MLCGECDVDSNSIEEQLEVTKSAAHPFEAMYSIAESLRDGGTSQVDLHNIFGQFALKHQSDKDETCYDTIVDVLDCIWSGGWGKGRDLFDVGLSDDRLRTT